MKFMVMKITIMSQNVIDTNMLVELTYMQNVSIFIAMLYNILAEGGILMHFS